MTVPVLLPKIFDHPFTYKLDSKLNKLKPGDFVEVQFGKKKEIGVIWDEKQETTKNIKLKSVQKKIKGISISPNLIKFINWFSAYNLAPKGLVLKMCFGDKNNIIKREKISQIDIFTKYKNFNLNDEQKNALKNLSSFEKGFKVSVLQGVTGSGKTVVYFERIKKIISKNKQVLILLPEIFLTNQFKKRFNDYFGYDPFIWHSKISLKKKRFIWQGVLTNKIKIVIGARSSLALPFSKLGLIVVDEEHDASYKQEEGIIYNARDMAILRASIENIPVNLITSIPSLETYNNIKNKKYNVIKLEKRFDNYPFPETEIINLNLEKLRNKNISSETIKIVKTFLDKNNQVLFFVNRRGYSPLLICKSCGFRHTCPNCSIYLTYHKLRNSLVCHHCGFHRKPEIKCKNNKSLCNFSMYGPGVEKVYDELREIFPNKNIKIVSSDYMSKKKEGEVILDDMERNKIDILIGTQMISKGFNFPKLNCIVVVDADFSGRGYDLRSAEKNIQLYNQLSGRAGRFSSNSKIIYQTITPTHKTLKDLIINNPEKFLIDELELRKNNNLPPFKKLIAIIISSHDKDFSYNWARKLKLKLSHFSNLEVLGPVEAPIFKINKKYRMRILIRSNKKGFSHTSLANFLNNFKTSSKIKLTVDVDPINFN
tara:strand:- start:2260 stop:4218 length:1959 start_codon:yes stop_codon:yes gene_type:complete